MNCPHCNLRLDFNDCINDPGKVPDNDSCGICYVCGGWWQMNDGVLSEYIPTMEQMRMVADAMAVSRARAVMDAAAKGKKLV